jgi:two-component system sensor histidine kinase ChvG
VQGARRLDEAAADLITARLQTIDLAQMARDMAVAFDRIHAQDGIHVRTKGSATANVAATEESLESILENLLDNAVGFSAKGGNVTVVVTSGSSRVRLLVEDEGPGVPPEQLDSIFRRNFSYRPLERLSEQ